MSPGPVPPPPPPAFPKNANKSLFSKACQLACQACQACQACEELASLLRRASSWLSPSWFILNIITNAKAGAKEEGRVDGLFLQVIVCRFHCLSSIYMIIPYSPCLACSKSILNQSTPSSIYKESSLSRGLSSDSLNMVLSSLLGVVFALRFGGDDGETRRLPAKRLL